MSTSGTEADFNVRSRVTKSYSVVHGVRKTIYPAKVFSIEHGVRKRVSKSFSIAYGVRVSIANSGGGGSFSDAFSTAFDSAAGSGGSLGKTAVLVYGVRSRTTNSVSVQYDVAAVADSTVSKSFRILYSTLIKPTVNEVITTPIEVDKAPPQIVTSSF